MANNGYQYKEWNAGDVITKNALNDMEHGIADVVLVQEQNPSNDSTVNNGKYNKIWINSDIDTIEIPTYDEYRELIDEVSDSKATSYNCSNALVTGDMLNINGLVYQGRLNPSTGNVDTSAVYAKIKVFKLIEGATITVNLTYGDGGNVNRLGIGLTNNAVPIHDNPTYMIVYPEIVTSDRTYTFINTENYEYCYVYFWTGSEYAGDSDYVALSVNTALETEIQQLKKKNDLSVLSCSMISDFNIGAITADETYDTARNRASSAVFSSNGGKRILNILANSGIQYNVRCWNLDKSTSILLYSDWTSRRIKSIDYPYYAIMLRKSDNSNFTDTELSNMYIGVFTDIGYSSIGEYQGKIISILGDSISTYGDDSQAGGADPRFAPAGCITNYPGNRIRYPSNTLGVTELNATYWYRVIERLGMTLGINESWAGSCVSWNGTTESTDAGAEKHIASQTRINHLGENGNPDIILINAGTNDFNSRVQLGEVDYSNPIDLTTEEIANLPVNTFAAAYRTMLIRVMKTYPNAKIICMTPSYTIASARSLKEYDDYCEIIKEVCDMLGVYVIDTRLNGISIFDLNSYLGDRVHYNYKGMVSVADLVTKKLLFNA